MTLFSSYTLAFFRIIKSNEGHKRYLLIVSHRREKLFVSHRGKCLVERNLKVAGGYLGTYLLYHNNHLHICSKTLVSRTNSIREYFSFVILRMFIFTPSYGFMFL